MTSVILTDRLEIATELYSFFKECCMNKKTRMYSIPFTFRSRVISKELFKRMNPEYSEDLKGYRIDLHRENLSYISHMIGNIFSKCEAKNEYGLFLVDEGVINKLKLFIKNNS